MLQTFLKNYIYNEWAYPSADLLYLRDMINDKNVLYKLQSLNILKTVSHFRCEKILVRPKNIVSSSYVFKYL